jgi:hypothetical protein
LKIAARSRHGGIDAPLLSERRSADPASGVDYAI